MGFEVQTKSKQVEMPLEENSNNHDILAEPVSYTHLTLPTIRA